MTGDGTSGNPYIVATLDDLQLVGNGSPYMPNAYYELANNIDAAATSTWNWSAGRGVYEGLDPIGGNFAGSFYGKFHTIDGVYVNRLSGYGGLFKYITSGTVKNLHVTNVDITISVTGSGNASFVGGLAGRLASGHVECVFTSGSVSGTNDDPAGVLHDYNSVGGLIGHVYHPSAEVYECGSIANVVATGINYAHANAGGLIGFINGAEVYDCYARGNATASGSYMPFAGGLIGWGDTGTVRRSFSTGVPTATNDGGLIAVSGHCNADVYNSFWDTETSGEATSGGGTGKTTAEMKTLSTFTDAGWDFATVWTVRPEQNNGYPYPRCLGAFPPLLFPTDPVARVSGIRRVYRPGLYRMELNLGDIGFDIDVSSAGFNDIPDIVEGPEGVEVMPEELLMREPYRPETWDIAKKKLEGIVDWTTISAEGLMLEFRRLYSVLTETTPYRPETWAEAKGLTPRYQAVRAEILRRGLWEQAKRSLTEEKGVDYKGYYESR